MTDKIQKILDTYNKDYDNISVYLNSSKSKNVQLNGLDVETAEYLDNSNILVRAVKGGKVVTSGFTGVGTEAIQSFLEENKLAIDSLPADENRYIPSYDDVAGELDVCDAAFDDIGIKELTAIASDVTLAALESDKRVKSVKQSTASATKGQTVIISTAGPVLRRFKTVFSAGAYLISSDGKEERDGYDSVSATHLSDIDYKMSGKEAAENACSLLGAKHINTGQYDILFSAAVMADFMDLVLELVDGESVYKGVSMLKGKLGEQCASKSFTLIDNPLLAKGRSSRLFDDEGQKCDTLEIFTQGVLSNYLHNSYTAKALGMDNNARGVIGGGGNLSIGCTNVSLLPTTDKKSGDVCPDCLKVTEVMGMHTADPISGDFSVGISGIVYKDGAIAYPFKEAVLSGNLAELLSGTMHVFDNGRTFGNITTSDTLFDKMTVSGV